MILAWRLPPAIVAEELQSLEVCAPHQGHTMTCSISSQWDCIISHANDGCWIGWLEALTDW
jgi:hypothetical protein